MDAEDIKSGGARYPGERRSGTRLARGPRRASERQVGDGFEGCLSFLLFAELRETIDELSEFEFEDESAEGTAAAIIPGIIDALEQEKLDLEDALGDDELEPETREDLEDDIEAIEKALEELQKELEELGISA